MQVKHLDHLNLTVHNFDATYDWYRKVFDFEVVEKGMRNGNRWGVLKAGDALLCIYEHPDWKTLDGDANKQEPIHRVNHFSFRIRDRKVWEERIKRENLPLRYGGESRYPHSTSWYVNDPTGYEIEVVEWDDDVVRF